jgi:ATP-binding cassette subfamily B protein
VNLPVRQYYQLLSDYLRPQWKRVTLLAILLFSTIGFQLLSPQIVRQFIDAAAAGVANEVLVRMGVLYLMVTLANQLLRTSAAYLTEDVKWRATNWLRNDLAGHCLQLDMAFHNEHTPGAMIERIDGDVNELSNFFSQFVIRILGNGLLLIGILVLLTREDWRIGAAYTGYAIVMVLTLLSTVSIGVPFWKERRQASSEMYGLTEEWLGGTEDINASGGGPYVMVQLQQVFYRLYLATRKSFLFGSLTWGMNSVFFGISTALALGTGRLSVVHRQRHNRYRLSGAGLCLRTAASAGRTGSRTQGSAGSNGQHRPCRRTDDHPANHLCAYPD